MIITLTSTHPRFSWLLAKNPQTQRDGNTPFTKSLRQGKAHAWFVDDQTFRLWFVDSPSEVSFAQGDFEYLDQTRYASPQIPIGLINEHLRTACAKPSSEDVPGHSHTIRVESLLLSAPSQLIKLAAQFADKVDVRITTLRDRLYRVELTSQQTLSWLLNFLQTVCILQVAADRDVWIERTDDLVNKYVKSLNAVDAPYFVRYLVAKHLVVSPQQFKRLKPELERPGMSLQFGDTREQRLFAVRAHLREGATLVDIGCGELYQASRLSKSYGQVLAYDADDLLQAKNRRWLDKRGIDNVVLHGAATPDLQFPSDADVLMTEVIEHMPKADAAQLLLTIRANGFRSLVVTVPNATFNQHYLLEDRFRHEDHHWEPTMSEFSAFLDGIFAFSGYDIAYSHIGDQVDGEGTSLMAVVTRLPEVELKEAA